MLYIIGVLFDILQISLHWASIAFDILAIDDFQNRKDERVTHLSNAIIVCFIISGGVSAYHSITTFKQFPLTTGAQLGSLILSILLCPLMPSIYYFLFKFSPEFAKTTTRSLARFGVERWIAKKLSRERKLKKPEELTKKEIADELAEQARLKDQSWASIIDEAIENRRISMNLMYFQGLVQSVPSCIIQVIGCALSLEKTSTIQIISTCVSIANVISKLHPLTRSFTVSAFFAKGFFLIFDIFKTLFILIAVIATPARFVDERNNPDDVMHVFDGGDLAFTRLVYGFFIVKIVQAVTLTICAAYYLVRIIVHAGKNCGDSSYFAGCVSLAYLLFGAFAMLLMEHGFLSVFVTLNHQFDHDVVYGMPTLIQKKNAHHEFFWGGSGKLMMEMTDWRRVFELLLKFTAEEASQQKIETESEPAMIGRYLSQMTRRAANDRAGQRIFDKFREYQTSPEKTKFKTDNFVSRLRHIVMLKKMGAVLGTNHIDRFVNLNPTTNRNTTGEDNARREFDDFDRWKNKNEDNDDKDVEMIEPTLVFKAGSCPSLTTMTSRSSSPSLSLPDPKMPQVYFKLHHLDELENTSIYEAIGIVANVIESVPSVTTSTTSSSIVTSSTTTTVSTAAATSAPVITTTSQQQQRSITPTIETVTSTNLSEVYLKKILGSTITNTVLDRFVAGFGFAVWLCSGLFNVVFPIVFASLYFDKFTTMMQILFFCFVFCMVGCVALTPSLIRYHISCFVLGYYECREGAAALFRSYFSVPIKTFAKVLRPGDKMIPRECFMQHVCVFISQEQFGLWSGDPQKFEDAQLLLLCDR